MAADAEAAAAKARPAARPRVMGRVWVWPRTGAGIVPKWAAPRSRSPSTAAATRDSASPGEAESTGRIARAWVVPMVASGSGSCRCRWNHPRPPPYAISIAPTRCTSAPDPAWPRATRESSLTVPTRVPGPDVRKTARFRALPGDSSWIAGAKRVRPDHMGPLIVGRNRLRISVTTGSGGTAQRTPVPEQGADSEPARAVVA